MAVFNQKKPSLPVTPVQGSATGSQSSVVGKTLLIKGEIFSDDEILIEGRIQGNISVKSRLVIGREGIVEADIEAREVVIKGKVTGNVKGSQRVEIVPDGTLHGNIQSPRVVIADSGFFEGSIEMHPRENKGSANDEKQADAPSAGGENANTHKTPRK
jgi:cytoskeletal protein CcmA (bactofilin family)